MGFLYSGQYRDELIRAELETLNAQAQLYAAALIEGAVKPVQHLSPHGLYTLPTITYKMIPDLSGRMIKRFGQASDTRIRLIDENGKVTTDSQIYTGENADIEVMILPPDMKPENEETQVQQNMRAAGQYLVNLIPTQTNLPLYHENEVLNAINTEDTISKAYRIDNINEGKSDIMMVASSPIRVDNNILGTVFLSRKGDEIQTAMAKLRFDILTVFLGALSLTIFMSLYLAHLIGRPLKKLARAAKAVRMERGREVMIPDFRRRNDEIGELSIALQEMTQALWDRMDTIERFAADVSHELKNPLSSLRSAVETVTKIENKKDIDRLMSIIQHDIQRLDRLITDISRASRLDAELSRDNPKDMDLATFLSSLIEKHNATLQQDTKTQTITLSLPSDAILLVRAMGSRLAQVFDNLLTNALSFSPEGGVVSIDVKERENEYLITVQDEGPGIPDTKKETIFERFYSERPKHEDYGSHSGLGLSISKQIIKAHGGKIHAENAISDDGKTQGARFVLHLPKSPA